MKTKAIAAGSFLMALMAVPASVNAGDLNIVNGSFELGNVADSSLTPIAGWSDEGASAGFWLGEGSGNYDSFNAAVAQEGVLFLTGDRGVGGADAQPADSVLSQTIVLSAENQALVEAGGAVIKLNFYYHDEDSSDAATIRVVFLDGNDNEIDSITTGTLGNGNYASSEWTPVVLDGWIDSETVSIRIEISTHRSAGSVTNLQFDNFTGSIEVPVAGEPGHRIYLDADLNNTTAWNGSQYDFWYAEGGTNWTMRTESGTSNNIYQSDYIGDSVRLKTTVTGLEEGTYKVYAYFMAAGGSANWRMGASLIDVRDGELPVYHQSDYPANEDLYIHYLDSIGAIPWGSWTTPNPSPYNCTNLLTNPFESGLVRLAQGDQRLIEVYLGVVSGTEFSVFIDDDVTASDQLHRTWYDGVAYESFVATEPSVLGQYPIADSKFVNPDDFPLSIGAVISDTSTVQVNPDSIELLLNGVNVIDAGDILQDGVALKTTTIDHEATTLPDGTNTVELVYSTYTFPTVFTTNTWSFVVASRGEPGSRVYVDADTTNTMVWTGTDYGAWFADGGTNWTMRTNSGNNDQIYQSDYYADSLRLKTTVSVPEGTYRVYAYFMAAGGGANWRFEVSLEDNLEGELPLYYQDDYPAVPELYVHYLDALDAHPWGNDSAPVPNPFYSTNLLTNPFGEQAVRLAQGDQRLIEVYLGTVSGTEVSVYVDDDPAANSQLHRTWFDGIGYEPVMASNNPDITNFSVSGGTATLIWSSELGGNYTIQHKASLTDPWSDAKTGIPAGGVTTMDSVSVSGDNQEFFRVKGQ
ncbi:MAG: hypothetical protein JXR25_15635 [Pontiellaceae bacterium]|nr:hypothetical protein [Pontiellaceae bacterium]MBN2786252.1 hypothetical protein [Pontiellaceae bacterium]